MTENMKCDGGHRIGPQIPPEVSRRQFLRDMGLTTGGMMIAGLSLVSACNKTEENTPPPTSSNTTPSSASSSSTTTTSTTSTSSEPADTGTSSTPASTVPTAGEYDYVAPDELPPIINVPGTECTIATDRKYSSEHIWVKPLTAEIAVVGISATMVKILGEPHTMNFPEIGLLLNRDDVFGDIEGYKLSADLLTPVSGKVLQINLILKSYSGSHTMQPLYEYPYGSGWMFVIELSKPDELNDLMDPEEYMLRVSPE